MNPSLLLIPDRYKAAKLYSQIPDSGAGDLSFTRANDTATRVNSAGLIEKVRMNANVNFPSWAKINGAEVLTSGVVDPFGGTNGYNLSGIVAGNYSYGLNIGTTLTVGASSYFTISIYAKGTGTIAMTAQGSGFFTALPITLTSNWTRYTLTISPSGSISSFIFYVSNFTGSTATSVDIAFPQAETGDIATDYIPTTTAAVSVGPVANIPRIDYTGGGCGKLLLEPQRTNLAQFSEQFDNAAWSTSDVTVTANTTISPSGYQDADTINAIAVDQRINQAITVSASTQYTFSFYAKKGTMVTPRYSVFDLSNSAFILTQVDYSSLVNTSTWSRITATFTTPAGCTSIGIYPINGASLGTIFLWGAQVEVGSYVSSYIPTLGASVTRSADAASKTGISSLIGQQEGTVFVDWQIDSMPSVGSYFTFLLNQSSGNSMYVAAYSDGRVQAAVFVGGILQCNIISSTGFITAGTNKFAFGYKANDFVLYANGVQVATDTSGSVPAATSIDLADTSGGKMNYNQAALFTTRLSNADLQTLTTL